MVETGGLIQISGLQPLVATSDQPLCFRPSFGVLSFWFHLAALSFASTAANKLANGLSRDGGHAAHRCCNGPAVATQTSWRVSGAALIGSVTAACVEDVIRSGDGKGAVQSCRPVAGALCSACQLLGTGRRLRGARHGHWHLWRDRPGHCASSSLRGPPQPPAHRSDGSSEPVGRKRDQGQAPNPAFTVLQSRRSL